MSSTIALLIFFSIFIPLLIMLIMKKKDERKKLPPGPKGLPIIGNLHQLSRPIHHSLRRLSNIHGSLMFLQFGSLPTLVVSSAAMAKEVLKIHDSTFASRPTVYALHKLTYNSTNISVAPYGKYWRQVRKIAVTELLSAKRVESFEYIREEEVSCIIKIVENSTANSTPINITELMFMVVNNTVLRVLFSKRSNYSEENGISVNKFSEIFSEIEELASFGNIADSLPWMKWYHKLNGFEGRLEKHFRALDKFYDTVIEEHQQQSGGSEHEDLLDVLLRIQNDPNQEIRLTKDNIKGVLMDMFIGGTDTSVSTLVWIMAELMKKPSAMRKAQEEVRGVVKEKGLVQVKERHLPQLVYLRMIVKEVLRLHPPAPLLLPRETIEKCSIAGYEIPARTRVLVNAMAIGTDSDNWEIPGEFRPERFLTSDIDFKGKHFELLPFGAGRRGCPGTNFAVMIIELAIANMLHGFDWTLPDGAGPEDIDMEETFKLTVFKTTPLYLSASAPSFAI